MLNLGYGQTMLRGLGTESGPTPAGSLLQTDREEKALGLDPEILRPDRPLGKITAQVASLVLMWSHA